MSAASAPPRQRPPRVPRPARLGPRASMQAAASRWSAWPWWAALGVVLLGALLLRLWGADHGMPYAYNADENGHFAPRAIGLYGHEWNPDYFVNPPAFTYLLHVVFTVWFGGREGVSNVFATDPTEVFVVARTTSAVLGTLAVWLLYLVGARLVDRRVGLLAAGLLAVGFLPVFYSHLALNDVPTLAPLCLALFGVAGVVRLGRTRDYAIAGVGLGLAAATKYTGGIVLLPLVIAAVLHFLGPGARAAAVRGLAVAGVCSILAFVAANPYVVLDFAAFWDGITHQSSATGSEDQGKLGLTHGSGVFYYLWSFTWGLGWVPLFAAGAAIPLLWRADRRVLWVLVPATVLYVAFMGTQQRYFGRWLIPIFPLVCVLASYAVINLADRVGARLPGWRPTLVTLGAILLLGQGLVYSLHIGQVLSREDTRNLTREWMVEHVPPNTKVVIEPVVPDAWAQDVGNPSRLSPNGNRWAKFPTSRSRIDPEDPDGPLLPEPGAVVHIEDFERILVPELVDKYEDQGYCWVVVGSTQRGRAEADPEEVPQALAYYRELERRATLAYEASPYARGRGPVEFNFDWTFDYYPLAYHRPGPVMSVYRLDGGACRR